MEQPTQFLQTILQQPAKETNGLVFETIKANKPLFWVFFVAFSILMVLSVIPLLGFIASIVSAILGFSYMFFIADAIRDASDREEYKKKIAGGTLKAIWSKYSAAATGVYAGWFVLSIGLIVFGAVLVGLIGGMDMETGVPASPLAGIVFLLLTILGAAVFYVIPLVFAQNLRATNFNEGFKSTFSIFRGALWREAFTGRYFGYMVKAGLIMIAYTIPMMIMLGIYMASLESAGSPMGIMVTLGIFLLIVALFQIVFYLLYANIAVIAEAVVKRVKEV